MCMNPAGMDMEQHGGGHRGFRNGNPVHYSMLKTGKEGTAFFPGQFAEPNDEAIEFDCGGLLFLAIGHEVGEIFLPYLQDLHMDERLMSDHPS